MTVTAILVALAGLLAGVLAGVALGRGLARREGRRDRLADQLRARDEKLQIYEQQVIEHFARAAALAEDLGRAWQELERHLADGAGRLANPELARRFTAAGGQHPPGTLDASGMPQPPRDYAPSQGLLRNDPEPTPGRTPGAVVTPLHRAGDDDPTLKVG
jgi:uncharacterized membrane-anchored protein YhcB (DUF1043 family)